MEKFCLWSHLRFFLGNPTGAIDNNATSLEVNFNFTIFSNTLFHDYLSLRMYIAFVIFNKDVFWMPETFFIEKQIGTMESHVQDDMQ